jgi:hypothetical protein
MMEVLVKKQAAAQRDQFAVFRLLEQIAEGMERLSPRQAEVVLTVGPAVEGMEVVLVVVVDVEQAWTLLFLRDSDPVDMPFVMEDSKDSEEDSESSSEASGSGDG